MLDSALSYIIPSLAPDIVTEVMWNLRRAFDGQPPLKKLYPESIISGDTAHITLKRRFYLRDGIEDKDIVTALDGITLQQVEVRAEKIEIFKTQRMGNVVVVLIENTPAFLSLHKNIYNALTDYITTTNEFEDNQFVPHLSLMYAVPDTIVEQVRQQAEEMFSSLTYTLTSFHLLKNIPGIKRERAVVKKYQF